jgi:uncharacterized protein YyaL (SSP411 family)
VEWYPWEEEAFELARKEQKPIFLSIGYSTCHWCHVMAHESFENPEIAALMNRHFINVKLDREERPDVDRLYMAYVQGLTGSGGWPMSVWLTPDLKPFFGGTYFPPENRHGRVGFPSVLLQLNQLWEQSREKIEQEAIRSLLALEASARNESMALSDPKVPLKQAAEYFQRIYDEEWGGFGSAPKFPRPSVLFFLLRQGQVEKNTELLRIVLGTLDRMNAGGIHDHLGGGFHRYSVDRHWHVPHFEKMLYDQAQLAIAYLEAWQVTGEKRHAEVVHDILGYVHREMTSPEGGFYSAEDADSLLKHGSTDHAEGAFFVWAKEEIDPVLDPVAADLFCKHYGVHSRGNVDPSSDPHGELAGRNVLMQQGAIPEEDRESLELSKKVLFEIRSRRPRPHLDDKILCAWNGLMISAFARAGAVFTDSGYLETAVKAAEFLKKNLVNPQTGELRRSWREGNVLEAGFAEDYAFLIQGLLDLYEATFTIHWLQWAEQLQTLMNRLFWDEEGGGYFSSAEGDPHLLVRLKEDYDGAEPSANSVAALNLLRFARMLGDADAAKRAEQIFALSGRILESMPGGVPQLLVALGYSLYSSRQIVIAGRPEDSDTKALIEAARKGFHPHQVILLADGGEGQAWLGERVSTIAGMKPVGGKAALYRCENFSCAAPLTDPEKVTMWESGRQEGWT